MERSFQRAKRGMARIREADAYVEGAQKREKEMASTRVKDIEDWIRIVQTRSRAIELLRRFEGDLEVAAFLEEVKQ